MSPQQIIELHTEADLVLCYQGKSDQLGARLIREPNLYEQLKLKEQIKRIKSYLNQSQKRIDQLCQIAIRQEKELSE